MKFNFKTTFNFVNEGDTLFIYVIDSWPSKIECIPVEVQCITLVNDTDLPFQYSINFLVKRSDTNEMQEIFIYSESIDENAYIFDSHIDATEIISTLTETHFRIRLIPSIISDVFDL